MNDWKMITSLLLLGLSPCAQLAADEKDDAFTGTFTVYERRADGLYRPSRRHGGQIKISRDGEFHTVDFAPNVRMKSVAPNRLKRTTLGDYPRSIETHEEDGQTVVTVHFSFHTLYLLRGDPPKSWKMADTNGRREQPTDRQPEKSQHTTAGGWQAWIERGADNARLGHEPRAIKWRQTVFRMGPDAAIPTRLHDETSTGTTQIALGEDGTLLVSPVGDWPRLYFARPGHQDNMAVIPILPPQQWDGRSAPGYRLAGPVWILGDVLVYGRLANPGPYLVGYVRYDSVKRRIVEQRLVAEVRDGPDRHKKNILAASFTDVKPVRMEHYVFWRNRGDPSADRPWAESRLRVIDLRQGKLVAPDSIDPKLLEKHKRELDLLKPLDHDVQENVEPDSKEAKHAVAIIKAARSQFGGEQRSDEDHATTQAIRGALVKRAEIHEPFPAALTAKLDNPKTSRDGNRRLTILFGRFAFNVSNGVAVYGKPHYLPSDGWYIKLVNQADKGWVVDTCELRGEPKNR